MSGELRATVGRRHSPSPFPGRREKEPPLYRNTSMSIDHSYEHDEQSYSSQSIRSKREGKTSQANQPVQGRRRGKSPQSVNGIHKRRRRKMSW